jgi:hypothetical protein
MALTQVEKDLLRYVVEGKKADEMKAISLSDELAREKIAEYVTQQSAPHIDFMLARRKENALATLEQVEADEAVRAEIQELINQLAGE